MRRLACAGLVLLAQSGAARALPADLESGQLIRSVWGARLGAPPSAGSMTQTRDGYLWIASGSGLTRFDGVRFRRLPELLGPGEAMLSPGISALLPDPAGGLWFGYQFGGVSLLRDGHLTNYPRRPDMTPAAVRRLLLDRSGVLWVVTPRGLWQLRQGQWHAVSLSNTVALTPTSLVEDRQGDLWVATEAGVYRRAAGGSAFERVALPGVTASLVTLGPEGRAWISAKDGTLIGALPRPGESSESVQRGWKKLPRDLGLYFDRGGTLWLYDEYGLLRMAHPERPDSAIVPAPAGMTSDVSTLFEDREGNFWITASEGLIRFRASKLTAVRLSPKTSFVSMSAGSAGEVWATTYPTGLQRIDDASAPVPVPLGEPRARHDLTFVHRDGRGRLWIGGMDGIWCLENGVLRELPMPPGVGRSNGGLTSDVPSSFTSDSAGAVWLGVKQRPLYRHANGRWEQPAGLPDLPLMSIASDSTGHVWVGYADNRLFRIDSAAPGHVVEIRGLAVGNLMALTPHGERLWIGGDAGIAMLDGQGLHPLAAKAAGALSGVSGIMQARSGDLWLNAVNGISQFPAGEVEAALRDPAHPMQGLRYGYDDGMTGEPAMMRPLPTLLEGSDGRLWFSASNGMAVLDPGHIIHNAVVPPVVIEELHSEGKSHAATQGLTLPEHTTELRIAYTALSLGIPERVAFRYRLQGVDADWQDAGNRREAFYTQLSPGDYLFQVRASNDDGVWNDEGASLSFRIQPAFYQTPWFAALCGIGVLVSLWGLHRLRLLQASAQMQTRLDARLAERERIARELHDTLIQGFHGLMLRFQTAAERIPKELAARAMMETAMDRADAVLIEGRHRLLDLRREEQSALGPALAEAGESLALHRSARFCLAEIGTARALQPEIGDAFLRIGTEALANAFRHAQACRVDVELSYGDDELRLRVSDDGRGMDAEVLAAGRKPGHWGLKGMRERAEQVGAALALRSRPGAGTELELRLSAARAYRSSPEQGRRRLRFPINRPGRFEA
jgi:signal transduction histidine kinase/ligand-binding sensor domain-containing protein